MSTLEVNKITPVSGGTTVQVGESGDTINIPAGATIANAGTATGFGVSLANGADNRVVTASSASALNGESNLTFDGTTLLAEVSDTGGSGNSNANGLVIEKNSHSGLTILSGNAHEGKIAFADADANNLGAVSYDHSANSMFVATNGANRIKVDSSGRVLINTTTAVTGEGYLQVKGSTNLSAWQVNSNGLVALRFFNSSGSGVGGITVNASGTVYATSSDYRLKENAVAISDGITRLKTLKPYRFNFIADNDADGKPTETVDGFFAHEVSSAVPEAITGTKDATETYTDDNGDEQTKIKPQGIDQAKLVPLLTSALQEAITKIETLEARVKTLEDA